MSEVTREIVHDKKGASPIVSWLALILAVVALLIAIMGYNRTGGDVSDDVKQQTNETIDDVQGQ